jgi:hypothetical protein
MQLVGFIIRRKKSKNKAARMPSRDRPVEEILYNDAIRRQQSIEAR